MQTEEPLVDKVYQLQKEDCKGGCTYIEIPEILMPKTPFGMLKVKGKIDDYKFSKVHLMPLGNGNLVMAVKAAIKKKIKKEAPDSVHLTIYEDKTPLIIPEELRLCMEDVEGVSDKFESYSDGQKKSAIDWINSAKTEQTKAERIAKTIIMVQNGEKFY
ncbi:YdeI/OmpD-associated family protein [uncultured Dysgonomonas sp.]|uniref:DUF1905 domain-containing protein n=1 Tax=uncultured Dysgonomonas sp. TaxID=206096 RepID=A0A212K707_9BACT|nr:YdeI/OmpD-associated family protein [uncultured Dysgonomonas sp.]SBW07398.1 conserved hypothetical protein [uncultured Dysgonomonas sp.]